MFASTRVFCTTGAWMHVQNRPVASIERLVEGRGNSPVALVLRIPPMVQQHTRRSRMEARAMWHCFCPTLLSTEAALGASVMAYWV